MNQEPVFKNYEFREIVLTFTNLVIKGEINNSQTLKTIIIKSYDLGGISQEQLKALLKCFNLSGEVNNKGFNNNDILSLLDSLLKECYISPLDYYISSALAMEFYLLTRKQREEKLKVFNIDPELLSKRELTEILLELKQL